MKKNFLALILIFALAACGAEEQVTPAEQPTPPPAEDTVPAYEETHGLAEISFRLEVTDAEGEIIEGEFLTTIENPTLGEVLYDLGIIDEGPFVTTVHGITADWDADNSWWAFLINGEMSPRGVFETYVEDGVTYAFVFTR